VAAVEPDSPGADPIHDCAIIGAGPGGLTAAIYLRRFLRDIVVLDAGNSRTRWIPTSHNCPGFPSGVSGDAFMARLREQAATYGTRVESTCIQSAVRRDDGFCFANADGNQWWSRTAILATGIVDHLPRGDWVADAIDCGALRLCAVCDAFEASDKTIAVHGPASTSLAHAVFLRSYSHAVTIVPTDAAGLTTDDDARRQAAGIAMTPVPDRLSFDGRQCVAHFPDGSTQGFEVIYPYLGSRAESHLATQLHARIDEGGELVVDRSQMTSIDGLYAVGDIVSALNQISVALGHAAIAATAIHKRLPPRYRNSRRIQKSRNP
jgi:thioredoxin reductase (NADPH)